MLSWTKVAPNISKYDNLPFRHLGDLTKLTNIYIYADKALQANPHIERVVGHSLGAMVGLELQKNYTGLKYITYGALCIIV